MSPGETEETELTGLRVLIVHEWLYAWAGAERCLEQMFEVLPQADLLVGVVTPEMRNYNDTSRRARESWVGRLPSARHRHRWFLPFHALAFAMEDTTTYDLVISSSHAFEKFVRARGRARHLCYCYSPPRFLWDMQHVYASRATLAQRAALRIAAAPARALDRASARRVDRFVSISRYIAERVERCYGVVSDVVYPPVAERPSATPQPRRGEPYLLHLGRLVEYKRIDLLVAAAERLRMRLIIAGAGPERERLARLAGPFTELRGAVSESEAASLLANCSAFAFAGEEDFGIALVEANAHGRPVVCYARGGAVETMVDGETAVMFHRQDVESIAAAVKQCLARSWDPEVLRRNAARFSPKRFRAEFRAAVESVIRGDGETRSRGHGGANRQLASESSSVRPPYK